ncbi:DUF2188 domain-containing protein [Oceanospirillum beijerinckii]|uniref:DUF2188 domain-containing protein n=1 Tax=Oceanospirillum beijerinckii TaxID=64976 RepID=UPI000568DB5E|nr:DUF2188 domain-containing protein [Oceanospirillum beijerinckii]
MNKKLSTCDKMLEWRWIVKKTGASRASKLAGKEDMIDWPRSIVRNKKLDVYIHIKDGRVQSKESYLSLCKSRFSSNSLISDPENPSS